MSHPTVAKPETSMDFYIYTGKRIDHLVCGQAGERTAWIKVLEATLASNGSTFMAEEVAKRKSIISSNSSVMETNVKLSSKESQLSTNSKVTSETTPHVPPGWELHYTDDGFAYYFHPETEESRWTLDEAEELNKSLSADQDSELKEERSTGQLVDIIPAPWQTHHTVDGIEYYFNPETDESVWTLEELEAHTTPNS